MISKETQTAPKLWKPQRGVAVQCAYCTYTSHVPHEVLVGLLGVPLLPLFASLHLGQQRLPVRLIGFDNVFQLLHEQQLQHALIRVQVCQLKQLPLQDVVIPDIKINIWIVNYQYTAVQCFNILLLY